MGGNCHVLQASVDRYRLRRFFVVTWPIRVGHRHHTVVVGAARGGRQRALRFRKPLNQDRVLAYDHHGNPGIAFYDVVDNDLRYARRVPGVGWVHSAVDTTGFVGLHPSLAYDRYERPAISYQGRGLK